MPSVINGIGTWYYGKRNIHRFRAGCEFCNCVGDLESYDTTLYFVVVFIPVIPIGKKRILSECPGCQKHRLISLKKWEESKVKSVTETLEKLTQNPDDSEGIIDALLTATGFQDEKLFDKLVHLSEGKQDDAKVQAALGSAYGYFSRHDEAIESYMKSLRADDTKLVRELLAESFLRKNDPENATRLIDHIFEDKNPESLWLVQTAIQTYQGEGNHAAAIALMDRRDAAFPQFTADKAFLKQRKLSERYLESGKKVKGANTIASTRSGTSDGSNFVARLAKWAFPLILILGGLTYLGVAVYKGTNRTVYLVNGSTISFNVNVNGTDLMLAPMTAVSHTLAEGPVTLETVTPGLDFEPIVTTIETNFWTRPFDGTVFIFNPDRLAPIVEETTTYAAGNPPVNPPGTLHIGEGFYQLPSVNYVFVDFPQTMQLKKGNSVTKNRVGLERVSSDIERLQLIDHAKLNDDQQSLYMQRFLKTEPDNLVMLSLLGVKLPPEKYLEFLTAGLGRRPLAVNWHRAYQSAMEKSKPTVDLEPEYTRLLQEINSSDAMYLLGRVLDAEKSKPLYLNAASTVTPSPFAMYALGYQALGNGEFQESLAWLDKALAIRPNEVSFRATQIDALFANREYDRILQMPDGPAGQSFSFEKFRAAVLKKDVGAIAVQKQAILSGFQRLQSGQMANVNSTLVARIQKMLDALQAAAEGKANVFIVNQSETPEGPSFYVDFLRGELESAAKKIDPIAPDLEIAQRGLVYLAARKKKLDKLANEQWDLMLKAMEAGDRDTRRAATIFKTNNEDEAEKLLTLRTSIEAKRIILLVAAVKFPEQADVFLALASKLDFEGDPTALCIKMVTKKK